MGFVADFLENTIAKKFRKSANICQSYERMYSGSFFDSLCSVVTDLKIF